jgi:hypothetical protein
MNGGGKSSMMNLFYSAFLPESREFLGSKIESKSDKRKLADYIKANDLAVVLSEWQMPSAGNLFSVTRIVGQVLAWKGGVAAPDDESRLEREFFTFRGSERVPFDSLPFHGLTSQPFTTLSKVKDWLAQLSAEYPQLEVERGDQRSKGKWRDVLDRVGIDTELFNYQSALARYDERFGRSELDGQIKQAELHLAELRDEHRKLSGGLSREEIAVAAQHPDLAGQQEEAERQHLKAHSVHETAIASLATAEKDRPAAPAHKQGLGLPPGQPTPETAAEAVNCREALDRAVEADTTQITALDSQISEIEREEQTLRARIGARTPHITILEDLIDPSDGEPPTLPADDSVVSKLVTDAKRQTQSLFQKYEAARGEVDNRVGQLHAVSRKQEFSAIPTIARERLANLPREELLQRCGEFIQSHEAWQKVLRNEIETLNKDKDLVVRALDGVAASAVRLLGKAERASIMPDAFPGWTGQPFLRITAQPVTEPAARRDRLAALVSRLVEDKAIPTGHALASAAAIPSLPETKQSIII